MSIVAGAERGSDRLFENPGKSNPVPQVEMKKLTIGIAVFAALILFVIYNVWRANEEPVTSPPTLVELGAQQLHNQLQQAQAREAAIEKQDWDSIPLLRGLIQSHQQRIEQLSGNNQAGEIIAHDKEAIARLERRISDLNAAAAAQRADTGSSAPTDQQGGQEQQAPGQSASPSPASGK